MAFNLMDMVKEQLSDQVLGQIGGVLGEDSAKTKAGVAAAVPTLLKGLMHKASTRDGARVLEQELDKQDDGLLDNLSGMFEPKQSSGLMDKGLGMLDLFMGGSTLGNVVNLIAKVSGLGGGSSRSMLGMLMPIVMGVLGRHRKSQGLDLGGLMGFLSDQKSNLTGLPDGLDTALGLSAGPTSSASSAPPRPAAAPTQSSGGSSGGGLVGKLLPLAALLGLAFLAFQFLGGRGGDAEPVEDGDVVVTDDDGMNIELPGAVSLPGSDGVSLDLGSLSAGNVGQKATELFGSATSTFEGITDLESAKAAVPKIEGLTEQFGTFGQGVGALPEAVRGPITQQVSGFIPTIRKLVEDKIAAIPGIGPILEPVITPLMDKLTAIAG